MDSMPQLPTAAMATRTTRPSAPAPKTPELSRGERPAGAGRDDGLTETAFPALLASRREVPQPSAEATKAAPAAADHTPAAESPAAPTAASTQATALSTGQPVTIPQDALIATLSPPRLAEPVTVDPAANEKALPDTTPKSMTPTVLLQGLALLKQPVFGTAGPASDPTTSPASDADKPASVRPALPPASVQVNAIHATVAAASQASVTTAATPAPTSATTLEAAAAGQEVYGQTPVVSEAQLLTALEKADGGPQVPLKTAAPAPQLPADAVATGADGAADATHAGMQGDGPADPSTPAGIALETAAAGAISEAPPELKAAAAAAEDGDASEVELAEIEAASVASATSSVGGEPAARTAYPGSTPLAASTARQVQQQVARQVTSRIADVSGQQKVTLRLNPESLGQVELTFEAKEDRLSVVISASNAEAESALRENLKDLTDRVVERSSRFSHVDIRVEVKDSGDTRQDSKQDNKQEGRQEQRREQGRQDGSQDHDPHNPHRPHAQRAWENAMSWQLADAAASEEG